MLATRTVIFLIQLQDPMLHVSIASFSGLVLCSLLLWLLGFYIKLTHVLHFRSMSQFIRFLIVFTSSLTINLDSSLCCSVTIEARLTCKVMPTPEADKLGESRTSFFSVVHPKHIIFVPKSFIQPCFFISRRVEISDAGL
jgi:hypothetical protein